VPLVKYNPDDQVKEDEMGRLCSTHEGGVHIGFCWDSQKERDHWGDVHAGGRIMDLRYRMGWYGLDSSGSG
jgi:hypothetical protein